MKLLLPLIALAMLSACNQPAQDPKTVAQHYWQAIIDGDTETAKSLIASDSTKEFDDYLTHMNSNHQNITQVALDDQRTSVTTTINPNSDQPFNDRPFETILVLEEGQWRIDLKQTLHLHSARMNTT